ncbi:bifunctional homocysteine S-methyltransferase/methylenetetrahydrofolate reductase [bacterium]|nr:bifunctional homocysteine S-methyltransferase/methylenetetrahydrofolate reductase [bacterium]
MKNFREYLKKNIVLFDGGMGSLIYQRGILFNKSYDELNLSNKNLILSIHKEYINAGADVIETNTFGANFYKLRRHNIEDIVYKINLKGAEIAREAADNDVFVCGSVGPLGVKIEPWGEISYNEAREAFKIQISALVKGGVDLIIFETFQEITEIEQAIYAAREVTDIPIIAQIAVRDDGKTIFGLSAEDISVRLCKTEADIAGMNCAVGPKSMLENLEKFIPFCTKPVSVMPNAGRARFIEGRTIYMSTPEYFGIYTRRFIDAGARIIGGCCGTNPDHIKKMAESIRQKQGKKDVEIKRVTLHEIKKEMPKPVEKRDKSDLAEKIVDNKFVTMVEMVAPRGNDISKQIKGSMLLKKSGVDVVNIPDGPRASARMNGMALALRIQQETKMETLLHYTCRDRNILGMQSDMLGAAAIGIKNILAITGDPPMVGDYPEATAVFDVDSIGLTNLISNLNKGFDLGGKAIGKPTGFLIGVGADPNSINPEREIKRLRWKIDAGAEFVITQPVFDIDSLVKFIDKVSDLNIPFIAGIWPLVSLRNAEFMRNEVPGVTIPDEIIEKMKRFSDKQDQFRIGIDIAKSMIDKVKSFVGGVQISAPFNKYSTAVEVAGQVLEKD